MTGMWKEWGGFFTGDFLLRFVVFREEVTRAEPKDNPSAGNCLQFSCQEPSLSRSGSSQATPFSRRYLSKNYPTCQVENWDTDGPSRDFAL
jgi:hypothetical protein